MTINERRKSEVEVAVLYKVLDGAKSELIEVSEEIARCVAFRAEVRKQTREYLNLVSKFDMCICLVMNLTRDEQGPDLCGEYGKLKLHANF